MRKDKRKFKNKKILKKREISLKRGNQFTK